MFWKKTLKSIHRRPLYQFLTLTCLLLGILVIDIIVYDIPHLKSGKVLLSFICGILGGWVNRPRNTEIREVAGEFYTKGFFQLSIRSQLIRGTFAIFLLSMLLVGYTYAYLAAICACLFLSIEKVPTC